MRGNRQREVFCVSEGVYSEAVKALSPYTSPPNNFKPLHNIAALLDNMTKTHK